jgi:molybdopterin-guanine dinucleotide biosynthesis protein A
VAQAAAVILAGGRGERLGGVIKANVEIGRVRLIDRVLSALIDADPVIVASGAFSDDELSLPFGVVAVPDAEDAGGPRAGVAAAVRWLKRQPEAPPFLLSVAVDTPFFPADFLGVALERIVDADAVVARFGGQEYPTNTLWRLETLAPLIEGPGSLKRLFPPIRTVWLDWDGRSEENPFANANTAEELALLRQRLGTHFGVGKDGQTR